MAEKFSERDQRIRKRDHIRQLEEKIQDMEWEKRRQEREMEKRILTLQMEKKEEEQDEMERRDVDLEKTDSVRQALNFEREDSEEIDAEVMQRRHSDQSPKGYREHKQSREEEKEISSQLTDELDETQSMYDKSCEKHSDTTRLKNTFVYESGGLSVKHGTRKYTSDLSYRDITKEDSQAKRGDERRKEGERDSSWLLGTPSLQEEIDKEKHLEVQRRKALSEEKARLEKERELICMTIKKERMKEECQRQQRKIDEQVDKERKELFEKMLQEERLKRKEEEYKQQMIEKERQMLIEERKRAERKQLEILNERDRLEIMKERLRKEEEEDMYQRQIAEQRTNHEKEEYSFQSKWKHQKDRIRKEMSIDQLQEESC